MSNPLNMRREAVLFLFQCRKKYGKKDVLYLLVERKFGEI
jgi:hypothetical protein